MPGRNQTGPNGMGPLTGRGLGNCSGDRINNMGRGYNRFGGNGRGRGRGRGVWSVESSEYIDDSLEKRLVSLENKMKEILEKI